MLHRKNYVFIFQIILVISVAYLIAYIMNIGIGGVGKFKNVVLMMFFLLLLSASKRFFWFFIFPFVCIHALYTPIGFSFGQFSYDFLVSGSSTDMLEAKEFIGQIKLIGYVLAIVLICFTVLFRYLIKYFNLNFYRNRVFLFIALLFFVMNQSPAELFKQLNHSLKKWKTEMNNLKSLKKESNWKNVTIKDNTYDNYLLIIGESARKDYHHAYGYPINNTPFMSSSLGVLVDGMTSGGRYTIPSLKVMLTYSAKKDWDANYSYDFISLAKKAGLETYWVSNQGYLSVDDTPISAIVSSSAHTFFIKKMGYNVVNTSDFILVDELKKILESNPKQKKLIVMHLYGSHPNVCDRVSDYPLLLNTTDYYSYLNCYISSIRKTDDVLKESYELLDNLYKNKKETFSLLYFADHGLAHNEISGRLYLNHALFSKFSYDIPLFKVSSNDTKRSQCKSFKSALNFTNGLASWMGINTPDLDPTYNLFDCKDDPNDFGLFNTIKNGAVVDDPAIGHFVN